MSDLELSALVSRTLLGLTDLEINDHSPYYLASAFFGTGVTWNRQKVGSIFVDGETTTQRARGNVTEPVGVEIQAPDQATLQTYTRALLDAFLQDTYTLTLTVDGVVSAWHCETADYQVMSFTTPRMVACQGQVLFQVPRQPVALVGGY